MSKCSQSITFSIKSKRNYNNYKYIAKKKKKTNAILNTLINNKYKMEIQFNCCSLVGTKS